MMGDAEAMPPRTCGTMGAIALAAFATGFLGGEAWARRWQDSEMAALVSFGLAFVALAAAVYLAIGYVRTERARVALAGALARKTLFFQELNHRARNNLSMIGALLRAAERRVAALCRPAIRDTQRRVMALSLVHRHLHKSGTDAVDCAAYLRDIAAGIVAAANGADGDRAEARIDLEFSAEPIMLPMARAQPLGIVLNEAMTNSLKHAFAGRQRGRIAVSLAREGGDVVLVVADDGIGLAPADAGGSEHSLGLKLTKQMADSLGGRFSTESKHGAGTRVTFALPETPATAGSQQAAE